MKLLKLSYIQEQHDAAERQLKSLKKVDSLDFGPDQEYYSLNGECYHFTEKYNYKLCPFDKSEQDGTSLGTIIKLSAQTKTLDLLKLSKPQFIFNVSQYVIFLGKWEGWVGDQYKMMKYSNGQGCWNGPARSTTVEVSVTTLLSLLYTQ